MKKYIDHIEQRIILTVYEHNELLAQNELYKKFKEIINLYAKDDESKRILSIYYISIAALKNESDNLKKKQYIDSHINNISSDIFEKNDKKMPKTLLTDYKTSLESLSYRIWDYYTQKLNCNTSYNN
jgi:hypothetical protein